LNYLEQYTSGAAQKIVVGLSYLDPETGYKAALRELNEKCGDKERIVNAFITKALSWAPIRPDNPKELNRFGPIGAHDNAIVYIALFVLLYICMFLHSLGVE